MFASIKHNGTTSEVSIGDQVQNKNDPIHRVGTLVSADGNSALVDFGSFGTRRISLLNLEGIQKSAKSEDKLG